MAQLPTAARSRVRLALLLGAAAAAVLIVALLWQKPAAEPEPTARQHKPRSRADAKLPVERAPAESAKLALPGSLPALPVKPEESSPVSPSQFFASKAEANCVCQARKAGSGRTIAELVTCRAMNRWVDTLDGESSALLRGVEAGRIVFDAAAAARCLRRLAACGEDDPADLACPEVYRGIVPSGGVCHVSAECAAGLCHTGLPSGSTGTCAAGAAPIGSACQSMADCIGEDGLRQCLAGKCQPLANREGAPCEFICESGDLWCDFATDPHVCRASIAKGAICDPTSAHCRKGLICRRAASEFLCAPPGQSGEACDAKDGVDHDCAARLHCVTVPEGDRCLPAANLGEPCYGDTQCRFWEAYCADATPKRAGRCEALPVSGEPCTARPVNQRRCRVPFVCDIVHQTCVAELAVGATCEGVSCGLAQIRAVTCVHGVCRARQPEGARCEPESQEGIGGELCCAWGLDCAAGRCVKR